MKKHCVHKVLRANRAQRGASWRAGLGWCAGRPGGRAHFASPTVARSSSSSSVHLLSNLPRYSERHPRAPIPSSAKSLLFVFRKFDTPELDAEQVLCVIYAGACFGTAPETNRSCCAEPALFASAPKSACAFWWHVGRTKPGCFIEDPSPEPPGGVSQ